MELPEALSKLHDIFRILIGDAADEWSLQKQSADCFSDWKWAQHLLSVHRRYCYDNHECCRINADDPDVFPQNSDQHDLTPFRHHRSRKRLRHSQLKSYQYYSSPVGHSGNTVLDHPCQSNRSTVLSTSVTPVTLACESRDESDGEIIVDPDEEAYHDPHVDIIQEGNVDGLSYDPSHEADVVRRTQNEEVASGSQDNEAYQQLSNDIRVKIEPEVNESDDCYEEIPDEVYSDFCIQPDITIKTEDRQVEARNVVWPVTNERGQRLISVERKNPSWKNVAFFQTLPNVENQSCQDLYLPTSHTTSAVSIPRFSSNEATSFRSSYGYATEVFGGKFGTTRRNSATARVFQCDVCMRRFGRSDYLEKHSYTHSGSRPYSCVICKKSYSQKSNLNRHCKLEHYRY